jgi:hypothetical protein
LTGVGVVHSAAAADEAGAADEAAGAADDAAGAADDAAAAADVDSDELVLLPQAVSARALATATPVRATHRLRAIWRILPPVWWL